MTGESIIVGTPVVHTGVSVPRVSRRVVNNAGLRLDSSDVNLVAVDAAYSSEEEAALMRRAGAGDASACRYLVDSTSGRSLHSLTAFSVILLRQKTLFRRRFFGYGATRANGKTRLGFQRGCTVSPTIYASIICAGVAPRAWKTSIIILM